MRSLFTSFSNPGMSDHSDQLLLKADVISEKAGGSIELAAIMTFRINRMW